MNRLLQLGDRRVTAGHNIPALAVNDVSPNVAIAAVPVPEVVRQATVPPVRVESRASITHGTC